MPRTSVTSSDGLHLAVTTTGGPDLPTVVAVHGYPDDHTVWDGVVAQLAATHRVVTYDVRGAGASDAPPDRHGYRLDQLERDLAAVVDAVSPHRPVHLLGHDWGAVQSWHAVTGALMAGRIASFTSISGPCLDHVGAWARRAKLREGRRQLAHSWYIGFFQVPLLPELAWRGGFGAVLARREGIPRPATRDGINGLELYRANGGRLLGASGERRTSVPVQVLAPTGDAYVTAALQTGIGRFVDDLTVRELRGGHWLPRERPEVVARCAREHIETVQPSEPGGRR